MAATTLTDRAVIRLSGDGVRGFLQGLVTSDVEAGLPVWTGLLTPQGKCLFEPTSPFSEVTTRKPEPMQRAS